MYDSYITKENDNLKEFTEKYATNTNDLNIIPVPDNLVPKVNSQYFDYYTITKGDTLYKIATDNNINPTLLAELNGLNETDYIYPNQVLLIPKRGTILYITAEGDTLNEIAKGLKIDTMKLLSQNNNIYLQPEQLIVYKYE